MGGTVGAGISLLAFAAILLASSTDANGIGQRLEQSELINGGTAVYLRLEKPELIKLLENAEECFKYSEILEHNKQEPVKINEKELAETCSQIVAYRKNQDGSNPDTERYWAIQAVRDAFATGTDSLLKNIQDAIHCLRKTVGVGSCLQHEPT